MSDMPSTNLITAAQQALEEAFRQWDEAEKRLREARAASAETSKQTAPTDAAGLALYRQTLQAASDLVQQRNAELQSAQQALREARKVVIQFRTKIQRAFNCIARERNIAIAWARQVATLEREARIAMSTRGNVGLYISQLSQAKYELDQATIGYHAALLAARRLGLNVEFESLTQPYHL